MPRWLDREVLENAVDLCLRPDWSTDPGAAAGSAKVIQGLSAGKTIEIEESIGKGSIYGRIWLTEDTAYVVFRGTQKKFSNLFLTNFQAFTCRHLVLDDKLHANCQVPHQGGNFQQVLPGEVHQGFARAASRLWYGFDLVLSPFVGEATVGADADEVFNRRQKWLGLFEQIFPKDK